ncbi:MAG: pyridoxamine 5'-phosphate oxidase family protein [Candidatus Cloacimonetes bacterium]|nr:pyridoxamine 5'-phosphate oxidase family protein [Candidatus Cloacimonadota bacterium]
MNAANRDKIMSMIAPMQLVYFATSLNQQPYVRPLTMFQVDSKYLIATGTGDAKVKQITGNPNFELCLEVKEGQSTGSLRLSGNVQLVSDLPLKRKVFQQISFIKDYWDKPEHPGFTLFHLRFRMGEYMAPGTITSQKIEF